MFNKYQLHFSPQVFIVFFKRTYHIKYCIVDLLPGYCGILTNIKFVIFVISNLVLIYIFTILILNKSTHNSKKVEQN